MAFVCEQTGVEKISFDVANDNYWGELSEHEREMQLPELVEVPAWLTLQKALELETIIEQ